MAGRQPGDRIRTCGYAPHQTTHPPAGATALLPCVDPGIWALKWYLLPVVLLSSSLVLTSALIVNNVQRQYPKFWIAPIPATTDGPRNSNEKCQPNREKKRHSDGHDLERVESNSPRLSHEFLS